MRKLYFGIMIILISACSNPSEQENQAMNTSEFIDLEENTIINLYDAFGKSDTLLVKDFGFSCIINYNGKIILFDAGSNADIFKNNVEVMKIDLKQIDFAIASHAHFDHINGFDYLLEINPDVKIYTPFDLYIGANIPFNISGQEPNIIDSLNTEMKYFDGAHESYNFNQSGRFWNANVEHVTENLEIAPGIRLVYTTSENMGYFSQYPKIGDSTNDNERVDNTKLLGLKEISLSLESEEGEVIIVGCSHSTVEKIIEETKSFTQNNVEMVLGGYHLLPYNRDILNELSERLMYDHKVNLIAPAHCTGHLAFKVLSNKFKDRYVYAGLGEKVSF